MKNYLTKSRKSDHVILIINESLDILESIGIPLNLRRPRGLEKMGMSFLALLDVKSNWLEAKSVDDNYGLSSKEVIKYFNDNFEENISLGSYDDVPRDYLELLLAAEIVTRSGNDPFSNYNSPKRKYTIPSFIRDLVKFYKTEVWHDKLNAYNSNKMLLVEEIKRQRYIRQIPVQLPNGFHLTLNPGGHNDLQKQIIEHFLPRFAPGCKLLYLGDGANKSLIKDNEELRRLNFFEISHGLLPDIVAYQQENNWLYLIEAFYSTGTISEIRMKQLKQNLIGCSAELIFVTAFLSREDFQKQMGDHKIAWESEVWTADHPDHLVHFNGHKFLGPMK